MNRAIVISCTATLLAGPLTGLLHAAPNKKGPVVFSDQAIREAIDRAVKYLWSRQKPDGSWEYKAPYPTGAASMACYALLESGVNPQEPKMRQALEWLAGNRSAKTYCLGLRCNAWEVANRSTRDKYRKVLERDTMQVIASTRGGSFHYNAPLYDGSSYPKPRAGGKGDNSCSQFGLLAMWAASLNGAKIRNATWELCLKHWMETQSPEGGWNYRGQGNKPTMTAAGIASMYVCVDNLYAQRFVKERATIDFKPLAAMQKGIDRIDATYKGSAGGYYGYGIERVGLASGYKYFNGIDWYKQGAIAVMRSQKPDGSFGAGVINTGFGLLFLIRGQHPVVFNKLRWTRTRNDWDWTNRPRDLAALTRWMSKTFEQTLNWQIVDLTMPVQDWHDAPILVITGTQAPQLTDDEIAKLRTYVRQGGTIFSCTELNSKAFSKGIREIYKKMLPDLEMTPMDSKHPIYTEKVYYDLGSTVRLLQINSGVRPLVIHCDTDLPAQWQGNTPGARASRPFFLAAVNIVRYVTGTLTNLRHRAVSHWPEAKKFKPAGTIRIVPLKHSGNWNPEPMACEALAIRMGNDAAIELDVAPPMAIADLGAEKAKIALLTGTGELALSAAEREILKYFVDGGGTLVVSAAGGNAEFAESAEELIDDLFASRRGRLRQLALASPLYRLKDHRIEQIRYRRHTYQRLRTSYPQLHAVVRGGRPGVIFSSLDLTAGLVGYPSLVVDGYHPDSAFEVMRNIILYASGKGAGAASRPAK